MSLPSPPEPVKLKDSEEQYKVEKILDSHVYCRQLQYLVHWQGYGEGDDTWEPAKNLLPPIGHSSNVVKAYHQANLSASQKIGAASFAAVVETSSTHDFSQMHLKT